MVREIRDGNYTLGEKAAFPYPYPTPSQPNPERRSPDGMSPLLPCTTYILAYNDRLVYLEMADDPVPEKPGLMSSGERVPSF